MVVLDTDHISLLEFGSSEAARCLIQRLDSIPEAEVVTTIISYEEQTRGWLALTARCRTLAAHVEAYRRMKAQLRNYCGVTVLDFDDSAAMTFARLQKHKLRIATMDLRIASIALANDAILLTRNLKDFRMVPRLRIPDWTTEESTNPTEDTSN